MATSLQDYKEELDRVILDLLWRQWSAVGVSGQGAQGGKAIVDPEALLLFSTVFARQDARLFDEIADWLQENGAWINLLRLGRLQCEHALGDESVLGALAEHLMKRSVHARWKVLAKKPPQAGQPSLLFPHLSAPFRSDEIFAHWGWQRGPLEFRGLSKTPRTDSPATFLVKLRAFFGLQSRAEVMAWLLSHDSGHPAQIARETGYFRGSIQNVLNELELSGLVRSMRDGREKRFIASREQWRFLLPGSAVGAGAGGDLEFPRWVPWAVVFTLVRRFHDLVAAPAFAGYSADLQAIELKRSVVPLMNRLVTEGVGTQEFAVAEGQLPPEKFAEKIGKLIEEQSTDKTASPGTKKPASN